VQADALSRGEVPPEFLLPGWRRVTISTATLTELLTRRDPWNVDVVFSCAGATPGEPPTELRAPHRIATLGKSRLGASLEAEARLRGERDGDDRPRQREANLASASTTL
jgi:hypothetical protein